MASIRSTLSSKKQFKKNIDIAVLKKNLKNKIFGQDGVIDEVLDTLSINMAGLGDDDKPIASFLFTGPTGVGKTEFAKELSSMLGMNLERFDMSEYGDKYSARNLTGGQKGLVGYEEGGILTNAITENPNSILLLDEIEKADKKVYDTFLQVLDYGTLTDTKGEKTDFTNCIIIMTSNLGASEKSGIGFGNTKNIYKEAAVVDYLTPEFRNRIDKMLEFNKLTKEMVIHIVDKFLIEFSKKLLKQKISISVSEKAKKTLSDIGFNPNMGARSVSRAINNEFKRNISQEILSGNITNGGKVLIDYDDKFIYEYKNKIKPQEEINLFSNCDFETAEEAVKYASEHIGEIITRNPVGPGYIVVNSEQ